MNTPEVLGAVRRTARERGAVGGSAPSDAAAAFFPRTAVLTGPPDPPAPPGRARKLDRPLTDPLTWTAVDMAVQWAGTGRAWPYAVILGPRTVTLRLAGKNSAEPAPPWRAVPGGWAAERETLAAAELPERRSRAYSSAAYAALGSDGADLVLLDLALAPGVLTVDGDRRAATELVNSLMAQVAAVEPNRVIFAQDLPHQLEEIEQEKFAPPTFLVCSDPYEATAHRLHQAAARKPWLRVVVLGETRGPRWSLTVDADGVVSSAALGLTAASAGLPQHIPPRPTPSPVRFEEPRPEPVSVVVAPPDDPPSPEEHPALLPLPPRDESLSLGPFASADDSNGGRR